jgi:peptide-methionine (S)-S-oxide reductase
MNMPNVRNAVLVIATALLLGCAALTQAQAPKPAAKPAAGAGYAKAVFAGGCFWCMEHPFDVLDGVISTTSGYTGGQKKNPTYEEVSSGRTGHAEAVEIVYDPKKVSYEKLLDVFWHNIDPTVKNEQFCDRGTQYRSGIFYLDDEQKRLAEASKAALDKSKPFKASIVTEITRAAEFYPAEDYHQDYYLKNPVRYKFYRNGCGRDARLQQLWGRAPE